VVAVRVLYGTFPPHLVLSRTGFVNQTLSDDFGQANIRALAVGHFPSIVAVAFTRHPTIAARTYPGQSAPAQCSAGRRPSATSRNDWAR